MASVASGLTGPGLVLERTQAQAAKPPASGPGERDENGVYRIGNSLTAPRRLDRPVYSPEAMAAGIEGNVVAEVVVNEAGDVLDAKIVRSLPLLDEAALEAVRNCTSLRRSLTVSRFRSG